MSNQSPQSLLAASGEEAPAVAGYPGAKSYCQMREPWLVSYRHNGMEGSGKVVGFSEQGWHILGVAPVSPQATLALAVHLPGRPGLWCIPSVTVQRADGLAFTVRVQARTTA